MAATNIQSFSGDVEVSSNLTVNTNTLHVDSVEGRVGIGKTDPAYAVDVNGTLNATSVYLDGSELESLWTSNISNAYYTTGAVGIGTDFPKKDLEVQGTLRLSNAATDFASDLVTTSTLGGWSYQQTITAPVRSPNDQFGFSVAISADGSYSLVGAVNEDVNYPDSGAGYVYVRSGTSWSFQTQLVPPSSVPTPGYNMGRAVCLSDDGSYAIVGSYGRGAYVFARDGSTWSYQQDLQPLTGKGYFSGFGAAVSLSSDGSYALVGAFGDDYFPSTPSPVHDNSGAACIFVRSGTTWTYQQEITAPDRTRDDQFGYSVAISADGSYSLVGANFENSSAGAGYVYVRSGTSWSYQTKLTYPIAQGRVGNSVSISSDGSKALLSRYQQPAGGSAIFFTRSGTSWTYQQEITSPTVGPGDNIGRGVCMSPNGSYAILSGHGDDDQGADAGAAHVFIYTGSTWSYGAKVTAPDATANFYFTGFEPKMVAISNDGYALASAYYDGLRKGAVYTYKDYDQEYLSITAPIEADGAILSFTGQHICFPEGPMSQGMVVSANKNKYVSLNGPLTTGRSAIKSSESLPVVSLSNVANDCSAFGVVDHHENGGTTRTQTIGVGQVTLEREFGDNRVIVNSLGEGAMWVANTNGPLESGDYITTSNIAGYGQRQDDDILHSYTVAKITMDCDFEPEDVPIHVIKKDENGQNVLDNYGRIQWEEVPDQTEKEYKIRYLTTDGDVTDQANAVWKAAYVGCTYHCG